MKTGAPCRSSASEAILIVELTRYAGRINSYVRQIYHTETETTRSSEFRRQTVEFLHVQRSREGLATSSQRRGYDLLTLA
jgi:hypothetical protein